MTREEAIEQLTEWLEQMKNHGVPNWSAKLQALDMAIESLSEDRVRIEVHRDLYGKYIDLKHKTEWIPCSERLPNELEAVNVTWVNHNPPMYYQYTKEVPNVDTAVNYRGVWYWWDSTICDVLAEYGEECGAEPIDKDIEIIAWMPLPQPYIGGDTE